MSNTGTGFVVLSHHSLCDNRTVTFVNANIRIKEVMYNAGSKNKNGGISDAVYSLVGQTPFRPKELRFHQINLTIDQFIAIEPGDVLGLFAAEYNPLPWTSVPCADARQRPIVSAQPTQSGRPVVVGRRLFFTTATSPTNGVPVSSCRQYSFSALLGLFPYLGVGATYSISLLGVRCDSNNLP